MPHTPAQPTVGQMIRISSELHEAVIAYAKDSGNTKAQAYRELLAEGLRAMAPRSYISDPA